MPGRPAIPVFRLHSMSFCATRILLTLMLLTGGLGCAGTSSGDGSIALPTFGAPEQWEPPVEETPHGSRKDP